MARLLQEAFELSLELADASAAVHDLLVASGPGRMRLRIDVELQLLPFLPIGGKGLKLRAVGHHNRNLVIIGVNIFFHSVSLSCADVRLVFCDLLLLYKTR